MARRSQIGDDPTPMAGSPKLTPSGFFVLRTPLLPRETLTTFGDGLEAPRALAEGGEGLDAALDRDRARLAARLRELARDPVIREALFVASPSLDEAIDVWLAAPADPRARGVEASLVRYVARMAGRATPFGLFSGCSTGTLGATTRLALDARSAYRRHTRLDMHYLAALCEALARDPALVRALPLRPSTGLYEAAGQLRYAEARSDPETRALSYHLVSVERTPYLDATLEAAARGARWSELAAAIVASDPELSLDDADGYIGELVESQILTSDVAPPITGDEPVCGILETLRACEGGHAAAGVIAQADGAIRAIDEDGLGVGPSRYRAVADALATLPAQPEIARLFQVDLYKPVVHAEIGAAVLRELERGVRLLARIARPPVDDALTRFRDAFMERYEGQTIPLTLALDEESGIGFGTAGGAEPSPLMEGLELPLGPAMPTVPFGPRERHMLRRLAEVGRARAMEWALDERDLEALTSKRPARLPSAFAVTATLAAASKEALARDDFRLCLHGVSGPSGAVLLGRFCHGDSALRGAVLEHLAAEEAAQPDAIFAEIVHLPEGRLGNILCRPTLRRWEIPYHGRSGVPEAQQIVVSDLRVRIEGGRIILSSARLGREVIPRLTSAHDWSMAAQGIYRFLCALQHQGQSSLGFAWGALGSAPVLPRVTHGRLVLSLARWNLAADQLAPIGNATGAERYRVVQRLRAELALPRWVGVADGDNVLPVDLDNVLHVESFAQLVKSRESAALVELWAEDALVVESAEGRFVHELVVPFVQEAEPRPSRPVVPETREVALRRFVPGSEWLYAKLYTGTASADTILKDVIAPLLESARATSGLDRWFFLRYGDPHWHLRVRLKGAPAALHQLREAAEVLLADGRLWKLGLDTYEREVERYGGPDGIELCEAIFEADSDAALGIIELLEADEGADARWRLALRGMHLLLVDLGLDLGQRIEVLREARASFGAEHHVDVAFERALGKKFRVERAALEALLVCPVGTDHPLDPGFALLQERSHRIAPLATELRAREGRLTTSMPDLAASLLHMHANRLIRSDARAHELVFYDFLLRLYESVRARREGHPESRTTARIRRPPVAAALGRSRPRSR